MLFKKKTVNTFFFWISLIFCSTLMFPLNTQADTPVVQNYLRLKAILKDESPIYLEPSSSSQQIDRAKQYSVVFIFYCDGSTDYIENGFYRAGKEPDKALGWIPQNMLREWNHKLCLHFSPMVGRQPALIFDTQDAVELAIRSTTPPDRSNAIAEEPGDISENRYSMLLPVLSDINVITSGQLFKAYQIGYLSGGDFSL